jgi:preprotein translocase subunit SecE
MANPFRKVSLFFSEMIGEMQKASWPTWVELKDSTLLVLVATLLSGILIALADFSVYNWIQLLTNMIKPGSAG